MNPVIVCVHATPRAIAPTQCLFAGQQDYVHRDVLEPALLHRADQIDEGRDLFLATLEQAADLEPAAILTTCSIYTRFLPLARQYIAMPILGIDEPMIDEAARRGGRIGLVGSIQNAIDQTAALIERRGSEADCRPTIAETLLVDPASAEESGAAQHVAARVQALASHLDTVLIVQLSLSSIADGLPAETRRRVLTSADTVLRRLEQILKD